MSTTYAMPAPICPDCRKDECVYDSESDGFYSCCSACFAVRADAPWCFHPECSGRIGGGRTQWLHRSDADGKPLYQCAAGHFVPMTLVQHWAAAGCDSGERDARRKLAGDPIGWLVDTRLESIGAQVAATGTHRSRQIYAQAYVAAALATLAGDDRNAR